MRRLIFCLKPPVSHTFQESPMIEELDYSQDTQPMSDR